MTKNTARLPDGPGAIWCIVKGDRLQAVREALDRFFAGLEAPDQPAWRGAFEGAVTEAVSTILEHNLPRQLHLALRTGDQGVLAQLTAAVRSWEGEPEPARVLDGLAARATRRGSGLDSVSHQGSSGFNSWTLRKRASLARAGQPSARRTAWRGGSDPQTARALGRLAKTALRLADPGWKVRIPYQRRADDLGELSRALRFLQKLSVERETLIQQAPVGIASIGIDGTYRSVNHAFVTMHGHATEEEMVGRKMMEDMDPDMVARHSLAMMEALEGGRDRYQGDNRIVRPDGSVVWTTGTFAPVRGPDGRPESFVMIVQDTTEHTAQRERAAVIQRHLLPRSAPPLQGYDLAGGCMAAQDVAGDLYDWTLTAGRYLDLTVADVMGKGMGAALVMAAARTALRAASADGGPAARVRQACEAMDVGFGDEGLFMTLFHARLDLQSGVLRYVDAGHGHWAIRRSGGELIRQESTTLPLFVLDDSQIGEGTVRLFPGDLLLMYSDGLVEREGGLVDLDEYGQDFDQAEDSAALVRRLQSRMPAHLDDDVTIVALRRLGSTRRGRAA